MRTLPSLNAWKAETAMRARAFPGEDPASLKTPEVVADAILDLVRSDAPTGHRIRVES